MLRGALLIAGCAVGAGMLGIPLVSAPSGFVPACIATLLVWLFMLASGLLLLEAMLWMPKGSSFLSVSQRFLGEKGRWAAGGMFIFLYYSLLVAYLAASAPLIFGNSLSPSLAFILVSIIFGFIILKGAALVDKVNGLLFVGLVFSFVTLIGVGLPDVKLENLQFADYSLMGMSVPVLFGAFGYHNLIPSLCDYFDRDRKVIRSSIILGTLIALVIYLVWQYLIIGAVSQANLIDTLHKEYTSIQALQQVTGSPWLFILGRFFGVFALTTSLLGVGLSMKDFVSEGLNLVRVRSQLLAVLAVFVPTTIFTLLNPHIFDKALGVAGGIGEAFLNGILPVLLVYVGRYHLGLTSKPEVRGGKTSLIILLILAIAVMIYETTVIFS